MSQRQEEQAGGLFVQGTSHQLRSPQGLIQSHTELELPLGWWGFGVQIQEEHMGFRATSHQVCDASAVF